MPNKPKCPKCGSEQVREFKLSEFGDVIDGSEPDWVCSACGALFASPGSLVVGKSGSCSICGGEWEALYVYGDSVCENCDARSVAGSDTLLPGKIHEQGYPQSSPVYVDGIRVWRRFKFGWWLTRRGSASMDQFYFNHPEKMGLQFKGTE